MFFLEKQNAKEQTQRLLRARYAARCTARGLDVFRSLVTLLFLFIIFNSLWNIFLHFEFYLYARLTFSQVISQKKKHYNQFEIADATLLTYFLPDRWLAYRKFLPESNLLYSNYISLMNFRSLLSLKLFENFNAVSVIFVFFVCLLIKS